MKILTLKLGPTSVSNKLEAIKYLVRRHTIAVLFHGFNFLTAEFLVVGFGGPFFLPVGGILAAVGYLKLKVALSKLAFGTFSILESTDLKDEQSSSSVVATKHLISFQSSTPATLTIRHRIPGSRRTKTVTLWRDSESDVMKLLEDISKRFPNIPTLKSIPNFKLRVATVLFSWLASSLLVTFVLVSFDLNRFTSALSGRSISVWFVFTILLFVPVILVTHLRSKKISR